MKQPVSAIGRQILISKGAVLHGVGILILTAAVAFLLAFATLGFDRSNAFLWPVLPAFLILMYALAEKRSKSLLDRARDAPAMAERHTAPNPPEGDA